ncbi:hypothetical protein [Streptomyces sp. S186]|uniref:hypothetical protein n=1 Tax=Streptomyces sp. S186 TaxID=3434395 RepID=UPI003F66CACC
MGTGMHGAAVETNSDGGPIDVDLLIENLSHLPSTELMARFCATCMCWTTPDTEV